MDGNDLLQRFNYHAPPNAQVTSLHELTRGHCLDLAMWMNDALPEGREKALVVTKLEEVMFWANAAIARHHDLLRADQGQVNPAWQRAMIHPEAK